MLEVLQHCTPYVAMLTRSHLIGLFLIITALRECHSQDTCHVGVDPGIGQTRDYSWDDNDSTRGNTRSSNTRSSSTRSNNDDSSDSKRAAPTNSYCGMFLDTSSSANCSGVGTTWRYCFYLSQYSSYFREAELALYRKKGVGSTEYIRVDESRIIVTLDGTPLDRDFYCQAMSIPPFSIVEGDVIGACMRENTNSRILPLDVVAELPGKSMSYSNQQCVDDLSSVDVSGNGWSTVSDLALHVYLSIVPLVPTSSSAFTIHSTKIPISSSLFQSLISSAAALSSPSHLSPTPSPSIPPGQTPLLNPSVMSENIKTTEPVLSQILIITIATGAACALIALLACCLVVSICCAVCWRRKKKYIINRNKNIQENVECETQFVSAPDESEEVAVEKIYTEPACNITGLFHQLEENDILVIPREEIQITVPIGRGQFTLVNRALWHDSEGMITEVAVKSLTPGSPPQEQLGLLREAAMMVQFHHPNVTQLIGIIVHNEQVTLVMELTQNGSLRDCLKSLNSVSSNVQELLSFSKDVALGMEYLTRKGFIHRNLSTQNVLLSGSRTCKIAGFGFSRGLQNNTYYVSTSDDPPHLKSAAPEAIAYKKYSIHGEVWSYGCLLYEIWSLGKQPFEELSDAEAIKKLASGYRHPPPSGCPMQIYELMSLCWHPDSHSRPGFHDIVLTLLHSEDTLSLRANAKECCELQPLDQIGSSFNLVNCTYETLRKI